MIVVSFKFYRFNFLRCKYKKRRKSHKIFGLIFFIMKVSLKSKLFNNFTISHHKSQKIITFIF